MMHAKRPKVIKAKLEKELERYGKRIQKLASKAYQIRTMLEDIAAMEVTEAAAILKGPNDVVTQEEVNAIHHTGSEGQTGNWTADPNAGQPDISDNIIAAALLDQQPTELPDDIGNAGESAGSGV